MTAPRKESPGHYLRRPPARPARPAGPGPMTRVALPRGHGALVNPRCAGGHDGGMAQDGGPDWAGYYAWSAGRQPRPLLVAPARNWAPARAAWQSTWAAGTAPRPSNCWLAAGQCWRYMPRKPGWRSYARVSRPRRGPDPRPVRVVHRGGPPARLPDSRRLQPAVQPAAGIPGPVGADPPGTHPRRGLRRPAVRQPGQLGR